MSSILPPVDPGEILRDEFLVPLRMSAGALAIHLNVPRTRMERLATQQSSVTPDTALRLAKFFRTTPEFWMNMQASYDLKIEAAIIHDQLAAIHVLEAGGSLGLGCCCAARNLCSLSMRMPARRRREPAYIHFLDAGQSMAFTSLTLPAMLTPSSAFA